MRRFRRAAAAVAAGLVLALLLGACGGLIGALVGTDEGLRQAGFGSVHVTVKGDDVVVSVSVDQQPTSANVEEVGAIIWRDLHERFTAAQITVHGNPGPTLRSTPTFAELEYHFGPRNPAWNTTDLQSSTIELGVIALGVALGLVVVGAGIVLLVLFLRRRRRRQDREAWESGDRPPWAGGTTVPPGPTAPEWAAAAPGPQWGPAPGGPSPASGWPAPPGSGSWGPPAS